MHVSGKFTPSTINNANINYSGFYLAVTYPETVAVGSPPVNTQVLRDLRTDVQPDGGFSFSIPNNAVGTTLVGLRAFRPNGTLAKAKDFTYQELTASTFSFDGVPADGALDMPVSAPGIPWPNRFRAKVVDGNGAPLAAGTRVIVWGKSGTDAPWRALRESALDPGGNLSVPYPQDVLHAAVATVSGTTSATTANGETIALVPPPEDRGNTPAQHLPPFVLLVVETLADTSNGGDTDDCACHDPRVVPHNPDAEDLVLQSDTYAQDIGAGCVNFTVPNRTLEEFSYHLVVRTTDPEVLPLVLDDGIGGEPEGPPKPPTTQNEHGDEVSPIGASMALNGRVTLNGRNRLDWDSDPTLLMAVGVAHGHLLHFKQVWKADGYSLGDLLYSLPLAPGQKKQIAVFDWDRSQQATREEGISYEESLSAYLDHNRDINEITSGVVADSMKGGSSARTSARSGGFGMAGGAFFTGGFLGVAGGFSSSSSQASSTAWQNSSRSASSGALQTLRDRVMQGASAVRNQRSTVVQTVREGESYGVQTESVANYNHCHALTIEYFEILRHFIVEQKLADVGECLFVPLPLSNFDNNKALRWRDLIEPALPTGRLRAGGPVAGKTYGDCYDALDRIYHNYVGYDLPATRYADEAVMDLFGELAVFIRVARPTDKVIVEEVLNEAILNGASPILQANPEYLKRYLETRSRLEVDEEAWGPLLGLIGWSVQDLNDRFDNRDPRQRGEIFNNEIVPLVVAAWTDKLQLTAIDAQNNRIGLSADFSVTNRHVQSARGASRFLRANAAPSATALEYRMTVQANPGNVSRAQITRIEIALDAAVTELPYVTARLERLTVRYATAHFSGHLCRNAAPGNDIAPGDPATLFCPATGDELRNPREEDVAMRRELLRHLNANIEGYHKAIWLNMDAERRFLLLDGALAPNAGGRSLASVVENRLVGIVGNSLVFPVAPGFQLDPTYRRPEGSEDETPAKTLFEHYAPPVAPSPYRISVPTRGVFAEAVRGACNACEKIDDTRYWRWEDSPIPDSPTAINPINAPTPQPQAVNLTPQPLAAPVVNIQNAPEAPGFQGANALMQLLSTPNLFQDITGLAGNQLNALQAMLANVAAAQGFTNTAGNMAGMAAKLKALDMIKDLPISSEEKQKAASSLLDSLNGPFGAGGADDFFSKLGKFQEAGLLDDKSAQQLSGQFLAHAAGIPGVQYKAPSELDQRLNLPDEVAAGLGNAGSGSYSINLPDGAGLNAEFGDSSTNLDDWDDCLPRVIACRKYLRNFFGPLLQLTTNNLLSIVPGAAAIATMNAQQLVTALNNNLVGGNFGYGALHEQLYNRYKDRNWFKIATTNSHLQPGLAVRFISTLAQIYADTTTATSNQIIFANLTSANAIDIGINNNFIVTLSDVLLSRMGISPCLNELNLNGQGFLNSIGNNFSVLQNQMIQSASFLFITINGDTFPNIFTFNDLSGNVINDIQGNPLNNISVGGLANQQRAFIVNIANLSPAIGLGLGWNLNVQVNPAPGNPTPPSQDIWWIAFEVVAMSPTFW